MFKAISKKALMRNDCLCLHLELAKTLIMDLRKVLTMNHMFNLEKDTPGNLWLVGMFFKVK